jgi:hypothetical protein
LLGQGIGQIPMPPSIGPYTGIAFGTAEIAPLWFSRQQAGGEVPTQGRSRSRTADANGRLGG